MNSKEKILSKAITLFAEHGYSGLSMRQLATAINMSVASIYHYFPDKRSLYLDAIQYAFSDKEQAFTLVWEADCSTEERLARFIRSLVGLMQQDHLFQRLMQREILEANPERLQMLAQRVFKKQFCLLMEFVQQLAPEKDAYLNAISIICLVKNHIENHPLHKHFPGWKPDYDDPDIISEHITRLLLQGLTG